MNLVEIIKLTAKPRKIDVFDYEASWMSFFALEEVSERRPTNSKQRLLFTKDAIKHQFEKLESGVAPYSEPPGIMP